MRLPVALIGMNAKLMGPSTLSLWPTDGYQELGYSQNIQRDQSVRFHGDDLAYREKPTFLKKELVITRKAVC
jgi:hypothetical protein